MNRMNELYFTKPYRRSLKTLRLEFGEMNHKFLLKSIEGEINGKGTSEFSPREEVFEDDQVVEGSLGIKETIVRR